MQSAFKSHFASQRSTFCANGRHRLAHKCSDVSKITHATRTVIKAQDDNAPSTTTTTNTEVTEDLAKIARQTAATFAPRASGSTGKNPAVRGSWLYDVFLWQGWLSAGVGGLLSFNLIFPSNEPDIARLMGMWSIWMLSVPSLRARECEQEEKDVLNLLFVGLPILNVILPFVYKSFAFVWSADMVLLVGLYAAKGLLPGMQKSNDAPPPTA